MILKYLLIPFIFLIPLYCSEAYIETASSTTQIPNLITGSFVLSDSIALIKHFDINPDKSIFTCKIPGLYLVTDGLQPGALGSKASGYLDTWFVLNGNPIPGSNSRQYINQDVQIALMTNTFLIKLKPGDTFAVKFTASGPDIGLLTIKTQTSIEPYILCYGLTMFKIY